MTPPATCPHCGGSIGLPHQSDVDCFRELDLEMAATLRQLRALTKRKGLLLRARIRARQREIAHRATQVPTGQKRLAGVLGPRNRPPSLFAGRRFGQPHRKG